MARNGDPARAELARRNEVYRARLSLLFAGRPVLQVKDLLAEAGLSDVGDPYIEEHYADKLMRLGYRPTVVPALSGRLGVLLFVRDPRPQGAPATDPRFLPYLEDGDPLMALLVGRAQREMELAGTIAEESGHGRT